MRINAVGVVGAAVPHREHAPPRAHGNGRLEVRRPDLLAVVAQPLRRLAEQLPHVELLANDARHLLPAERVAVVEQEVAPVTGHPRYRPPAPCLVGGKLLERRLRHADQRQVAVIQVDDRPAQPVGERRATGARHLPVLPEHQVVDEQPRATLEELWQRPRALLGREPVLLLHGDPRQLPPLLLDPLGVLLELALGREQLLASHLPLLLRPDLHWTSFALTSSSLEPRDGGKLIGSPNASNSSGRSQWTTSTTRPSATRSTASASGRWRGGRCWIAATNVALAANGRAYLVRSFAGNVDGMTPNSAYTSIHGCASSGC